MSIVACVGGERLWIDVGVQAREPGADHLGHPQRVIQRRAVAAVELLRQREPGRVGVMDGHALDLAVLGEHVDRAPVRDLRDGQACHLRQRLGVVHRGGEHAAGLRHEALSQLRALYLGDVLEHVHHVQNATALGVEHRR